MIKPKHFLTKAIPMALIASTVLPTASFADQQVQTKEINEAKVLDQSKEISKKAIGTSDTVILVKAGNDKEILKATVIAAEKKNPVLIADDVNEDTIKALKDLGAKNVLVSGDFDKKALKDFKAEDFKASLNRGSKECVVLSTKDKSTALSLSALAAKSGMDVFFDDDNLNEIHDNHYDKIYVTSDELAGTIKGNAENLKGKSNFETELNIAKKAKAKNLILLTNTAHNLNAALLAKSEDAALVVVNDASEIEKATKELNPGTVIMLGDARTKSSDTAQLASVSQNAPAQMARRAVGPQRSYSYKVIQNQRIRKQPVRTIKTPAIDLEKLEKEIRDAFADENINTGNDNKNTDSTTTTPVDTNKDVAPVGPVTVDDTNSDDEKEDTTSFKDNLQVTSEKLESLRAELQNEKAKKSSLLGEISSLEAKVNNASNEKTEEEEIVVEPETSTEEETEVVSVDNSGKIADLRASVNAKRGEVEGLRAQLNNFAEYVEIDNPEYERQLKEINNSSNNSSSSNETNNTTNNRRRSKRSLDSTTNKYPTVSKKITVKNEERKSLEGQISSLEGMIAGLENQISALENQKTTVVKKKAKAQPKRIKRAVKVDNTQDVSALKEELSAKRAELEEVNKRISYIQEDINKELANIEDANNRREAESRAKAEKAAKKAAEKKKAKAASKDQARADIATSLINAYIAKGTGYDDAYAAISRIKNDETREYLFGQLNNKSSEIEKTARKEKKKAAAGNVESKATKAFNNYKKSATTKSYNNAVRLINQLEDEAKKDSLLKKLELQRAAIEKIKASEEKKNNNKPVSNAQVLSRLASDLQEFRSKGYSGLSKSNSFYLSNVSGITAAQLEKGLQHNLKGLGKAFVKAEKDTGVNAILLAAMASHESDYGRSNIARSKGNLFGWNAVDADPYNQASTYSKFEDSIREVSKKFKRYYLSPNGKYFNGYTTNGINRNYSSDKDWPSKVNQHMVTIAKLILGK